MNGPLYEIDAVDKKTSPNKFSISMASLVTVSFHLIASPAVSTMSLDALSNLYSVNSLFASNSSFYCTIASVSSLNFYTLALTLLSSPIFSSSYFLTVDNSASNLATSIFFGLTFELTSAYIFIA